MGQSRQSFKPSDTTDNKMATGSVVLKVSSATPATGNPDGESDVGESWERYQRRELVSDRTLKNTRSGSVTISNGSISGPRLSVSGESNGTVLTNGQSAFVGVTLQRPTPGVFPEESPSPATAPILR